MPLDQKPFERSYLTVTDVQENFPGNKTIYYKMPEGVSVEDAVGLAIPASLSQESLQDLKNKLAPSSAESLKRLIPSEKYPKGPDYSKPTDTFLKRLLDKAIAKTDSETTPDVFRNTACLYAALEDRKGQEISGKRELQANYNVFDLISLFPDILSADDLITCLDDENGNKTYASDNRPGKPPRLNVQLEEGAAFRAKFGETDNTQKGAKAGFCSAFLNSLKTGDRFLINGSKPGPQLPEFKKARHSLPISQGNAALRMQPLLEKIKERKSNGFPFGKVIIAAAFKDAKSVLEMDEFRPYLADGTLDELHLFLSREEKDSPRSKELGRMKGVTVHTGARMSNKDLLDIYPKETTPFVLTVGGITMCKAIGQELAKHYEYDFKDIENNKATHDDMRMSRSADRRHELQGKEYTPTDIDAAMGAFTAHLNNLTKNNRLTQLHHTLTERRHTPLFTQQYQLRRNPDLTAEVSAARH